MLLQPPEDEVTWKPTVFADVAALVKDPEMFPVPLKPATPPEPVTPGILSRVQEKLAPAVPLVNTMVVKLLPLQAVWLAGLAITFGLGFTVIVAVPIVNPEFLTSAFEPVTDTNV